MSKVTEVLSVLCWPVTIWRFVYQGRHTYGIQFWAVAIAAILGVVASLCMAAFAWLVVARFLSPWWLALPVILWAILGVLAFISLLFTISEDVWEQAGPTG